MMIRDGLSKQEATRQFWCVDKQGLLVDDMADLRDFQKPYTRARAEVKGWKVERRHDRLAEVVERADPTIIVGTSTVGGAFTEAIVREMARNVDRPHDLPNLKPN